MMKKKIIYNITIGSHFPEKITPTQIVFPIGGVQHFVEVIVDWNPADDSYKESRQQFLNADEVLRNYVKEKYDKEFHIWYWSMYNVPDETELGIVDDQQYGIIEVET